MQLFFILNIFIAQQQFRFLFSIYDFKNNEYYTRDTIINKAIKMTRVKNT